MKTSTWCLEGDNEDHHTDTTIDELFEANIAENKDDLKTKTALVNIETGVSVTYGELENKAEDLSRKLLVKLRKDNLKPNSDGDYIVGLRFLPSEDLVITILALFKAGLAYVPIAPNWPEGRIEYIIGKAQHAKIDKPPLVAYCPLLVVIGHSHGHWHGHHEK